MLKLVAEYDEETGWGNIGWEDLFSFSDDEELEKYRFYWVCPACVHYNPIQHIGARRAELCERCDHQQYGFDYVEFKEI